MNLHTKMDLTLCIAVECPSKNGVSSTFMNRIMKTINKSNLSGKYIR